MKLSIVVEGMEITFEAETSKNVIRQVLQYVLMERVYPEIDLMLRDGEDEKDIVEYFRRECEMLGSGLLDELLGIAFSVYEEIREAIRERTEEDDIPF